jgi:outer membrane lipoprotein SlyB
MRKLATILTSASLLSACATGANLQSNVYRADQVNQRQEAKVISVLAVLPAKVEVNNQQAQQTAQVVGGLLGALAGTAIANNVGHHSLGGNMFGGAAGGGLGYVAGSMVPGTTLVDGVSLTYVEDGQTLNSAQVGKLCEFQPGKAIVISTGANETRIQPNATCQAAAT